MGRDVVEPEQRFTVRRGDWQALRRVLEALPYDGAIDRLPIETPAPAPPPPFAPGLAPEAVTPALIEMPTEMPSGASTRAIDCPNALIPAFDAA